MMSQSLSLFLLLNQTETPHFGFLKKRHLLCQTVKKQQPRLNLERLVPFPKGRHAQHGDTDRHTKRERETYVKEQWKTVQSRKRPPPRLVSDASENIATQHLHLKNAGQFRNPFVPPVLEMENVQRVKLVGVSSQGNLTQKLICDQVVVPDLDGERGRKEGSSGKK